MDVQPRELKTYETEDGDAPFLDWLDNLRDRQARAIIKKRLDRIALGNFGDTKFVGEGCLSLELIMDLAIGCILLRWGRS